MSTVNTIDRCARADNMDTNYDSMWQDLLSCNGSMFDQDPVKSDSVSIGDATQYCNAYGAPKTCESDKHLVSQAQDARTHPHTHANSEFDSFSSMSGLAANRVPSHEHRWANAATPELDVEELSVHHKPPNLFSRSQALPPVSICFVEAERRAKQREDAIARGHTHYLDDQCVDCHQKTIYAAFDRFDGSYTCLCGVVQPFTHKESRNRNGGCPNEAEDPTVRADIVYGDVSFVGVKSMSEHRRRTGWGSAAMSTNVPKNLQLAQAKSLAYTNMSEQQSDLPERAILLQTHRINSELEKFFQRMTTQPSQAVKELIDRTVRKFAKHISLHSKVCSDLANCKFPCRQWRNRTVMHICVYVCLQDCLQSMAQKETSQSTSNGNFNMDEWGSQDMLTQHLNFVKSDQHDPSTALNEQMCGQARCFMSMPDAATPCVKLETATGAGLSSRSRASLGHIGNVQLRGNIASPLGSVAMQMRRTDGDDSDDTSSISSLSTTNTNSEIAHTAFAALSRNTRCESPVVPTHQFTNFNLKSALARIKHDKSIMDNIPNKIVKIVNAQIHNPRFIDQLNSSNTTGRKPEEIVTALIRMVERQTAHHETTGSAAKTSTMSMVTESVATASIDNNSAVASHGSPPKRPRTTGNA